MSRLREALQRIEQRAAAASAGHRPALRVDQPAEGPVPPSNLFAAHATPAVAAASAANSSRSIAETRIIEPASGESPAPRHAPMRSPMPQADHGPAIQAAQPAFAQASFADITDSAVTTGADTPRIDLPHRVDQDHAGVRAVHAKHEPHSPHLPAVNWKSVTTDNSAKNSKYENSDKPEVTTGDALNESASDTVTAAVARAVPAPVEEHPALADEPSSVAPTSAAPPSVQPSITEQPRAHEASAADLIIPAAPPEPSGPSEVSFHPPSPIAAPHVPASRFAAAADPARNVTKPFQQTCRKVLAALPGGGTPALLFAAVDGPYNSAATVANLAAAMTDQIDAPVLAIDASRDAALTKELRVKSTNALMRILRGTTSWEDCIVQTSLPGLCLLPSKPGQDRVAPFAFQRLLTELKSQFGLLLIDVGTFDETMALSLAGLCTATYLTVRQGQTTKDRARAAQRQLKSNGANLAGCVLIAPSM